MTRGVALVVCFLIFVIASSLAPGCSNKKRQAERRAAEEEQRKMERQEDVNLALTRVEAVNARDLADKAQALLKENPPNIGMANSHLAFIKDGMGKIIHGVDVGSERMQKLSKGFEAEKNRADAAEKRADEPLTARLNAYIIWLVGLAVVGMIAGMVGGKLTSVVGESWSAVLSIGYALACGAVGGIGLCLAIESVGPYKWIFGLVAVGSASLGVAIYAMQRFRAGKNAKIIKHLRTGIRKAENETPADVSVMEPVLAAADEDTQRVLVSNKDIKA